MEPHVVGNLPSGLFSRALWLNVVRSRLLRASMYREMAEMRQSLLSGLSDSQHTLEGPPIGIELEVVGTSKGGDVVGQSR